MTDLEEIPEQPHGDQPSDLARCARLVAALQDEAVVVEVMARSAYDSAVPPNDTRFDCTVPSWVRDAAFRNATAAYRALLAHLTRDMTPTPTEDTTR